jgi:hypothetical protein
VGAFDSRLQSPFGCHLIWHEHLIDHHDDAIALVDIDNRHFRRIALVVRHHKIMSAACYGELVAFNCFAHVLSRARIDVLIESRGVKPARYDMVGQHFDEVCIKCPWEGKRPRVTEWFNRIKARAAFKPAFLDWCPPDLTADLLTFGRQSWPSVERMLAQAG